MKQPNLKNDMISHLSKLGFKFGVTPQVIERQIKKLMGTDRYSKYQNITAARDSGLASIRDLYQSTQTLEEANLLLSYQSAVLLENTGWFMQQIKEITVEPASIIDFGCATGATASWLAHVFPKAKVFGVDRESHFIDIATKSVTAQNAKFFLYDYSADNPEATPKAQFGVSSFGIDFQARANSSLSLDTVRDSKLYDAYKHDTSTPLRSWRAVIQDYGYLLTVLRIPGFTEFIGIIDAAYECGWSIDLSRSKKIKVEDEIFPGLVFKATNGEPPLDDELLGFWIADYSSPRIPLEFSDAVATAMFNCLAPKKITESQQHTYADGHTMQCDIGLAGAFCFLFAHATTGYAHLILESRNKIESLKITQNMKYGF